MDKCKQLANELLIQIKALDSRETGVINIEDSNRAEKRVKEIIHILNEPERLETYAIEKKKKFAEFAKSKAKKKGRK